MKKGIMLVGEPMGLFIAQTAGSLDRVSNYSMVVAGAEFNVAVGLARLEHTVTYLTKLGNDPFGKLIIHALSQNGIGSEFVSYSDERPTGFMLKGKSSKGEDPEIFYFRKNSAASTLSKDDVGRLDFSQYGYLHLTGILPALSSSTREATFHLMDKAHENGLTILFDPNLRPQLWPNREEMVETINALAAKADYVLPGEGEGKILCGTRDPKAIGAFYLELGVKAVIVKVGSQGAYLVTKKECELVPGYSVNQVVDTVGAGDGFAAGIISALVEQKSLIEATRRGNGIGAIQVMNVGDNDGLPTRTALAQFMRTEDL